MAWSVKGLHGPGMGWGCYHGSCPGSGQLGIPLSSMRKKVRDLQEMFAAGYWTGGFTAHAELRTGCSVVHATQAMELACLDNKGAAWAHATSFDYCGSPDGLVLQPTLCGHYGGRRANNWRHYHADSHTGGTP